MNIEYTFQGLIFEFQVVVLDFPTFCTEEFRDNLIIVDGPNNASPVLQVMSGCHHAYPPVGSTTEFLLVMFKSDGSTRMGGFNITIAFGEYKIHTHTLQLKSANDVLRKVDKMNCEHM